MDNNFEKLVTDYLMFAKNACGIISDQAQTSDILRAANTGKYPHEGSFSGYGGGTYFIHGSGCEVHAKELEIDFDFGPENTIPGFDPWKLYNFAQSHSEAYEWLPDRASFNKLIDDYVEVGILKRINLHPSPHLLCVRNSPAT